MANKIHYIKSEFTMSKLRDLYSVSFRISIKCILTTLNISKVINLINTHKGKSRDHFNKL